MHLLFVYGTLKQGFRNHDVLQGARLLAPEASIEGLRMYQARSYPYAAPANRAWRIFGEIYAVSDEVLDDLDILEGHPEHYQRKRRTAVCADGRRIAVWVYIASVRGKTYPVISSGRWS